MGRLEGKTAVITGGARGQGRSHAVIFAREGADIVICDVAEQVDGVPYPMGNEDDLAETVRLVEAEDRRCVAVKADTRSEADMKRVADTAIAEFGKIDSVIVNHGISVFAPKTWELSEEQWHLTLETNLTGVWQTVKACIPHMIEAGNGGSIGITSSTAGDHGIPVHVALLVGQARSRRPDADAGHRAGPVHDPRQHRPSLCDEHAHDQERVLR